MSEPCNSLALVAPADPVVEDAPFLDTQPEPRGRVSEHTIRLMENWIVGVVTVLSAGVILATLWTQRDQARSSGQSTQEASDAGRQR
jgi:hypothetical protein